jgi:hypothetical protein
MEFNDSDDLSIYTLDSKMDSSMRQKATNRFELRGVWL